MPAKLKVATDGMTFDLPAGAPLLVGPAAFGGAATVGHADERPWVSVVNGEVVDRGASLYVVRSCHTSPKALGRLRRRVGGALLAAPPVPDGPFDASPADVLLARASDDPAQTARETLRVAVLAAGRPVLLDVGSMVPPESLLAALDAGAAGVVVETGDELRERELLEQLTELDSHRLDDAPTITVAICAYNAAADLDRCLASLTRLRYPRTDVLVCDDGSGDGTVAVAKRYGVRVVELGGETRGTSHIRNVAIENALGDYMVFLDSDTEVDPLWLSRLYRLHDRLSAAVAGGPNRQFQTAGWQERAVGGAPGVAMPVVRADGSCTHLPGCCISVRTEVAREVRFNEDLPLVGDDLDFCYRLTDAGHELVFHPTATMFHHRRRSLKAYMRQMFSYGRYAQTVAQHHGDRLVEPQNGVAPKPVFVGPQAEQRYSLANAPLVYPMPLKALMATVAAGTLLVPAGHLAGRGKEAGALTAAAALGQLAYVTARVPAQPGLRGLKAVRNRLVTTALWYAGPGAVAVGKLLGPGRRDQ